MMTTSTTGRDRARERQRQYRERQRAGVRVALIEISEALVEVALVAGGFISEADADDPLKVNAALSRAVQAWAEEQLAATLVEDVTHNGTGFKDVS